MKAVSLLMLAVLFGTASQITATPVQYIPATEGTRYLYPHFSPDGKYLLFLQQNIGHNNEATDGGASFCVSPLAKTLKITQADAEAMKFYRPPLSLGLQPWMKWLPGSQQFGAVVERVGTKNHPARDIWFFNLNGMLVKALFPRVDPQPYIQDVAIAPDGETIAISIWTNDNDHLYIFTNLDNATMKEVGNPDAHIAGMTWTADSTTLIFSASGIKDVTGKVHGTYDLWQYRLKDSMLTNFTHTDTDSETHPLLTADGKTLYYTGGLNTLALDNPLEGNGINQWLQMNDIFATPVSTYAPKFICSGTRPVIAQDGNMLFVYQQRSGMGKDGQQTDVCYGVIFDTEGRELKSIYFGPEVYYLGEGFSFSPDGNSFAFAKDGSIWIDTVRWNAPRVTP